MQASTVFTASGFAARRASSEMMGPAVCTALSNARRISSFASNKEPLGVSEAPQIYKRDVVPHRRQPPHDAQRRQHNTSTTTSKTTKEAKTNKAHGSRGAACQKHRHTTQRRRVTHHGNHTPRRLLRCGLLHCLGDQRTRSNDGLPRWRFRVVSAWATISQTATIPPDKHKHVRVRGDSEGHTEP